jgi:phosphate transport system protein
MREAFADQLDGVVSDLVTLTQMVQQATSRASHSLMNADAHVAEQVIADDEKIDALREHIEEECFDILARQQPVAGDLRMLVAAVRMVSDLERMGDLSVHVAKVAQLRMPGLAVPEEMVPIFRRMSEVALHMIGQDAQIIANRDVEAARRLEEADEEMDELRKQSFRILLGDSWQHGVEPAIDVALVGRYYERIGDHAVSIARRVIYLVTGDLGSP